MRYSSPCLVGIIPLLGDKENVQERDWCEEFEAMRVVVTPTGEEIPFVRCLINSGIYFLAQFPEKFPSD
jgi:hypothetical protein